MSTVILIDDRRTFLPQAPQKQLAQVLRTSSDGLRTLQQMHRHRTRLDELWLDHDLGQPGGPGTALDTIEPVVLWLCETALNPDPLQIGRIYVHTSNGPGRASIVNALRSPRLHGVYRVTVVNAAQHLHDDATLPPVHDLPG